MELASKTAAAGAKIRSANQEGWRPGQGHCRQSLPLARSRSQPDLSVCLESISMKAHGASDFPRKSWAS